MSHLKWGIGEETKPSFWVLEVTTFTNLPGVALSSFPWAPSLPRASLSPSSPSQAVPPLSPLSSPHFFALPRASSIVSGGETSSSSHPSLCYQTSEVTRWFRGNGACHSSWRTHIKMERKNQHEHMHTHTVARVSPSCKHTHTYTPWGMCPIM